MLILRYRTDLLASRKPLVVDDHAGVASVIRATADSLGFTCQTVNRSEEALAAFLSFRPDILVLDMMMPEKDGIDVLYEIVPTDVDTKFILISGYGDGFLRMGERIVREYRRAPVAFLKKPSRHEELVSILTAIQACAEPVRFSTKREIFDRSAAARLPRAADRIIRDIRQNSPDRPIRKDRQCRARGACEPVRPRQGCFDC